MMNYTYFSKTYIQQLVVGDVGQRTQSTQFILESPEPQRWEGGGSLGSGLGLVEGGRHEGRQEEEREEGLENVVSVAVVAVESRQSAGLINFVDLGVLARCAEMAGGAGLCQERPQVFLSLFVQIFSSRLAAGPFK